MRFNLPMSLKTSGLLLFLLLAGACHTAKKTTVTDLKSSAEEQAFPVQPVYRSSNTILHDLIHTRLEVTPDWGKKQLSGKATITLTPHFYPAAVLFLHARGMDLHEVSLFTKTGKTPLKYTYENDSITIMLDRTYTRGEQFQVYISYTAKPEELKTGGSAAITSDKGLYFINADGREPEKPTQLWTQGETQSNSVWFPTIDSPNEKMTQEIYITVDTVYTTLSNGLMIRSVNNNNGTKTDYWKQTLPAAPYLTMMAVGKFAVVKDSWRNMEVSYYVEPEYEKYARMIFGHTPEMLEFFSKKLGVDYAWEKYSQVVVRDYVSGAMENTTAVVHGEYMQQDAREYLDNTFEYIISHELFHHWFGDLVTCESWSNVPLNESFATYGQYLWSEYKYGRDEADYGHQQDLNEYLSMSRGMSPHLIRFDYESQEDMFDVVSYQKGGRILHMLRKVVGDDAFFASLKLYLDNNKFKTVEVHQLRLAFESVTGRDLNWFFNEWFLQGGHPELKITYEWKDAAHKQVLYVEQKQDFTFAPLYRMPVAVDLYYNDTVIRREIWLSQAADTFSFDVPSKPMLVNFDAEKMLLAVKNDGHQQADWIYMFEHAPLYADRYESLSKLIKNYSESSPQVSVIKAALHDKYWNIRALAVKNLDPLTKGNDKTELMKTLIGLIQHDPKSAVRAAALKCLARNYDDESLRSVYDKAAFDSSYEVMGEAVRNYVNADKKNGLQWLRQFENESSSRVTNIIADIYSEEGTDENKDFFINALKNAGGLGKYELVSHYSRFLSRCKAATIDEGVGILEEVARTGPVWWIRMSGTQALADIIKTCDERSTSLEKEIADATTAAKPRTEIQALELELKKFEDIRENVRLKMIDIKKNETDKNLKKIYNGIGN